MKRIATALVIAALCAISARGQSFQNLDFESAYGLPGSPGNGELVSVANALPDWTAYYGPPSYNDPFSSITYVSNSISSGLSEVILDGGSLALSGEFSVGLYEYASISQTGLVPENAGSLQFEALGETDPDVFSVTLDGQSLSFSEISAGSSYNVYSANIPAGMDGQMEALTFDIGDFNVLLDNIGFVPIPEPSEYALLGVGVIVFGFWRWRQQALG